MLRRTALVVFSLLVFFFFGKTTVHAQTTQIPVSQPVAQTSSTDPNVPQNLHNYTQNVLLEVLSAAACQLSGTDPINPNQKCLGVDRKTGKIGFVENGGGLLAIESSLIAMTFNVPVHTSDFTHYVAGNFGISQHAYAVQNGSCGKGIGFCGLSPLLPVWTKFRDLAYLAFVVIFVLIGVAIMLRIKIDARTVMTVENSIPKVIISIIMVTFSFAIAGFLIDLMYVVIYLAASILNPGVNGMTPAFIQDRNPLEAVNKMGHVGGADIGAFTIPVNAAKGTKEVAQSLMGIKSCPDIHNPADIIQCAGIVAFHFDPTDPSSLLPSTNSETLNPISWIFNIVSGYVGFKAGMAMYNFTTTQVHQVAQDLDGLEIAGFGVGAVAGILADVGGQATGVAAGATVGAAAYTIAQYVLREILPFFIAYLIFFIALVWALFRVWTMLLKAYVFILVDVIFSPFWMLAGAAPGEAKPIGNWIRDLLANLSTFPVVYVMFLLGNVFLNAFSSSPTSFFVPPLIGNPVGTNGNGPEIVGSLIGFGVILLTPQVANMMHDFLKAPEFKYVAGIGQAVGIATGAPGGMQQSIMTYGQMQMYGSQVPLVGGLIKRFGQGGAGSGPPKHG